MLNRLALARHFQALTLITRQELFGSKDKKYAPQHLQDDATTMFAGHVGIDFKTGHSLLVLAINPGGGGDKYTRRTPEDEDFYPLLSAFRIAPEAAVLNLFEKINQAFEKVVRGWNLWRILDPTLQAVGAELREIAYMNVVPYRTRENWRPPAAATRLAWKRIISPTMALLSPRAVVTLGKKAGSVVDECVPSDVKHYCVPRTNGDRYLSSSALTMHGLMRSELTGK